MECPECNLHHSLHASIWQRSAFKLRKRKILWSGSKCLFIALFTAAHVACTRAHQLHRRSGRAGAGMQPGPGYVTTGTALTPLAGASLGT